ncbi:MAG: hypothetical protein NZ903_01405 [Candidatus Micrarchaeota archaeon]|nr:hypothetical protein [Candidatus Micrarchaeota archaeon]
MANDKNVRSVKELTEKTVEEGGVLAVLYFDAIGKEKEKLELLLVDLVNTLNSQNGVVYCVGDIQKAMQLDGGEFSATAKVTILTKDFLTLAKICEIHGPIGIEILKPSEIVLKPYEAQQLLLTHVNTISNLLREILERTMTPEERKKLAKILDARAERSKELLESGKK